MGTTRSDRIASTAFVPSFVMVSTTSFTLVPRVLVKLLIVLAAVPSRAGKRESTDASSVVLPEPPEPELEPALEVEPEFDPEVGVEEFVSLPVPVPVQSSRLRLPGLIKPCGREREAE